jgi:hypothetical protein
MTGCGHEATERSRSGAGDETTRCDVAGDGEADHLVPSGRDPWHQLPAEESITVSTIADLLLAFAHFDQSSVSKATVYFFLDCLAPSCVNLCIQFGNLAL